MFRPNITVDLSKPFSLAFWTHSFTEFPGSPYSLGNRKNEGILVESCGDTEEASLRFRYMI
ncbi:MAG: hypothetical protein IPL35_15220 [Sphingobacteriales bacterium]|nr:hypothetical protein [Sphingobacteriales bacterium]